MTESHPYVLEGVGKNMIPGNLDFALIDRYVRVNDKDSAFRARQLAKREGIFSGYSSGAAVQALWQIRNSLKPEHIVVVLLPDHGSKYMSKIYNDGWMQKQGFIRSLSKYSPSYVIQKRIEKVYNKYVKGYGSV
jgi:cystathionine beta-synthase